MQGAQASVSSPNSRDLDALMASANDELSAQGAKLEQTVLTVIAGFSALQVLDSKLYSIGHKSLSGFEWSVMIQARAAGEQGFCTKSLYQLSSAPSNANYGITKLKKLGYLDSIEKSGDGRLAWHRISAAGLEFLQRLEL